MESPQLLDPFILIMLDYWESSRCLAPVQVRAEWAVFVVSRTSELNSFIPQVFTEHALKSNPLSPALPASIYSCRTNSLTFISSHELLGSRDWTLWERWSWRWAGEWFAWNEMIRTTQSVTVFPAESSPGARPWAKYFSHFISFNAHRNSRKKEPLSFPL